MKKILSVLGNILLVVIILIAVVMTFASLKTNDKGLSEIGGYMFLNIQSGSMEPTIMTGDLIVIKVSEKPSSLKVGDIVSFVAQEQNTNIIKTHRITTVDKSFGDTSYITKGDNNPTVDEGELYPSAVIGVYQDIRIPIIGYVFSFLSGRVGFFICIVLPLFILFVYQIYKFISAIMEEKKKELIEQIKKEQAKES